LDHLGEDRSSSRPGSNYPLIDYQFRAFPGEGHFRGAGNNRKPARHVFAPGFRALSNEFLGAETKRSYVAEVLFFAIIVGVSVWPIISMVRALAQLIK
jgi:hypothetical protein